MSHARSHIHLPQQGVAAAMMGKILCLLGFHDWHADLYHLGGMWGYSHQSCTCTRCGRHAFWMVRG